LSLASLQGFAPYDHGWQHRKLTPPTNDELRHPARCRKPLRVPPDRHILQSPK